MPILSHIFYFILMFKGYTGLLGSDWESGILTLNLLNVS